jgi:hypothetical protein
MRGGDTYRSSVRGLRGASRKLGHRLWLVAPLLVVLAAAGIPVSSSLFTANTTNASTLSSAASFPTYPSSVTGNAAQFYHRGDDAVSDATTSTAADSSGNNRPGTYAEPTDGPSTWYQFDDGSGSSAADSSGVANGGTLIGSPTWSSGHTGTGGLTFNGTSQYLTGAGPAVNTSTSYTVAAWVKIAATDAGNYTVLSQDGVNASGFILKYFPGSTRWQIVLPNTDSVGGSVSVTSTRPAALGQWTHLAAVYDDPNDQVRLYIGGALVGTATQTVDWAATGSFIVGASRWGAGTRTNYFNGSIDDVRTFRRALNATEVAQVYGSPSTWWNFNAVNYTQTDQSGNGNTGTLTGSPTFGSNAVILNGTSQYGTGATPGMHTDRDFSVAAWVYPSSVTGTRAIVSQPGATSSAFTLGQNGATYTFSMTSSDVGPSTTTATSTTAASTSAGAHVVGVYSAEADEMRLYVNGRSENIAAFSSAWDATGVLNVGRARSAGTYGSFFAGKVDDLQVFDRVLTGDDVQDMYNTPVARYDFDDAGSATTAVDGSGNGADATKVSGTVTWQSSSHRGGADTLDGTGYLTTSRNVLDTSQAYSVSAWVNLTATGGGNKVVVAQNATNTSPFQLLYYNSGGENVWGLLIRPSDSTAVGYLAMSASPAIAGRWTHLVGVYDKVAGQANIYVNGALSGTVAVAGTFNSASTLMIGAGLYGGSVGTVLQGRMDEIAVYQRALGVTDVLTIYDESPHLRFDLNENTGTSAGDRSGGTGGATLTNGPTWATGTGGSALAFDGTNDYVVGTANSPIATNDSLTVSAWVYLADTSTTHIAVSQNSANFYAYALGYGSASGKWVFSMSNTNSTGSAVVTASSTSAPVINTWTHLVGVYDSTGQQIQLYVDGVREASVAKTSAWTSSAPVILGYANNAGAVTYRWAGRIDEVSAYQSALRLSDVQALYDLSYPAPNPTAVHLPGMTAGVPGALQGSQQGQQSSTAVAFNGTSNAFNPIAYNNPVTFTLELWFKTTSTTGGALMAFTSTTTGTPANWDRIIYLDSNNRIAFGAQPSATTVRALTGAYNDGQWHHVAASLGAAGMKLYIDGALIATNAAKTTAQVFTGYWRWGGVPIGGWYLAPTTSYLTGTIDEVAVYPTQLTDNEVARHYAANH